MIYPSQLAGNFASDKEAVRATSECFTARISPTNVRPWIEGFDTRANANDVHQQVLGTKDAGTNGFMVWWMVSIPPGSVEWINLGTLLDVPDDIDDVVVEEPDEPVSPDALVFENYPNFFYDEEGNFTGQIVVGANSPSDDVIAAIDIVTNLPNTKTAAAVTSDDVEEGKPVIAIGCTNPLVLEILGINTVEECRTLYDSKNVLCLHRPPRGFLDQLWWLLEA